MGEKEQLLSAGEAFTANGELDEALLSYESAAELDPDDADLQMKIGTLLSERERSDEAASAWTKAAKIYEQQGLLSEALSTQKKIVEAVPASTDALERLAQLHIQLDQNKDAVKALRNVAARYREEGDDEKRLAAIGRVLSLDPGNLRGRVRYSETIAQSGDLKAAAAELKKVLAPLQQKENWDAFEKIAKRCLALDNTDPEVSSLLAKHLLDKGRVGEALYALNKSYSANSDDPDFLGYIADACLDAGQPQKAVIVLKRKAEIFSSQGLDRQAREVQNQIQILDPTASGADSSADNDEGFNEFEAGELKIADISDEEIDALLQEIEKAETEDEFSVGAFLDELHADVQIPSLPPPPPMQSKALTQRGIDVPFATDARIQSNFSEDNGSRALATTEISLPIPPVPSALAEALGSEPPPPPQRLKETPKEQEAAYADTMQVDYAPQDALPLERQDTVPHKPLGNTQDWGAPHFIEPIDDPEPLESGQADEKETVEKRFENTTALGTSDEVIGAASNEALDEPMGPGWEAEQTNLPPEPPKTQESEPAPAPETSPTFQEANPITPPPTPTHVVQDNAEEDFTETMPVRPPPNPKATMPTPPPSGSSDIPTNPPPIPAEANPAPTEENNKLTSELDELDFYLENELRDEARELVVEIQRKFGESAELQLRVDQLKS